MSDQRTVKPNPVQIVNAIRMEYKLFIAPRFRNEDPYPVPGVTVIRHCRFPVFRISHDDSLRFPVEPQLDSLPFGVISLRKMIFLPDPLFLRVNCKCCRLFGQLAGCCLRTESQFVCAFHAGIRQQH